jgi:glycosyltransferase involved in cell wall biosynthesis
MTHSRILISINSSWNIHHFRAPLIHSLQRAGYTILSAAPEDTYTERLKRLVSTHFTLPMDNAGTSPAQDALLFLRYLRLLRRVRPEVLLTYTIKPNIYGSLAAGMLGVPVIANVSGLGTAFIRDTWLTQLVTRLYRLAFRSAACVFFQNPEDRALFLSLNILPESKTALLPGSGIDLEYFSPLPTIDAPADSFVLIARLLEDKGIREYVEAARIIKAKHPAAIFRLVGPWDVQNQTAIAKETLDGWVAEGIVEYLGETDDVRAIIAGHACVVLPSYREGLPRTLLEAAAMGKPLIASDVAGCRHIVTHGENGLLCAAKDSHALAHAFEQFLHLPAASRIEMGRASRRRAERDFNQQRVFDAYLEKIAALTT